MITVATPAPIIAACLTIGTLLGIAIMAVIWALFELHHEGAPIVPGRGAGTAVRAHGDPVTPAGGPATDWGLLAARALDLHIERTDATRAWAAEHGTGGAR